MMNENFKDLFIVAAIALCGAVYMLPSIVGWQRKHYNRSAILLLNILTGWSGIGYLCALWIALDDSQPPKVEPGVDEERS